VVGPERVKFAIMRLRRKLGQGESTGPPIEAVRGFGYRYVAPSAGWQAKQAAGRPAGDAVSGDSRTPQPRRPASPTSVGSDADPGSRS
jgi:DNA-binding winged helix-turn-helix (wHTH) protein